MRVKVETPVLKGGFSTADALRPNPPIPTKPASPGTIPSFRALRMAGKEGEEIRARLLAGMRDESAGVDEKVVFVDREGKAPAK
jgi:hypothetical protein